MKCILPIFGPAFVLSAITFRLVPFRLTISVVFFSQEFVFHGNTNTEPSKQQQQQFLQFKQPSAAVLPYRCSPFILPLTVLAIVDTFDDDTIDIPSILDDVVDPRIQLIGLLFVDNFTPYLIVPNVIYPASGIALKYWR